MCVFAFLGIAAAQAAPSLTGVIDGVQPKIVKIYGAGGLHGMAAYQTGIMVSSTGHILTAFSHVLDTEYINVVLADGRKFAAKLLGADPRLEIAVLKIEAVDLPHFDLAQTPPVSPGQPILAFSNAFGVAAGDEAVSVQKGTISILARLDARRGVYETPYHGAVYVLDATTNNSGAAGGALVTTHGQLVGMLGKELRNAQNNTWLNYAIPIDALRRSVEEIRSGKFVATRDPEAARKPLHPLDLAMIGIVLVPDVLERTPPYVDHVHSGSPADKAGIRPDDLILLLDDRLTQSCRSITDDLAFIDQDDEIKITLLHGQNLREVTLRRDAGAPAKPQEGRP